ncbi:MAG: flagellar protein export ATPase FliI [Anaerolineales bacterium]|nr:flagellar protein export ATPase FliI [Anaerolineales bacterium]MBP6208574.1 flagellar protein export ATPase FliI [Anaerolineales bacterium]MBP8164726.1 flagellar protein export ATPase FliI [Anaerolineales bacterium]
MEKVSPDLSRFRNALTQLNPLSITGKVVQVVGLTVETMGLNCQIGEVCEIQTSNKSVLLAEAIGFRNNRMLLMPLGNMEGIQPDSVVRSVSQTFKAPVGRSLIGRVLNGLGEPIDGKGPLKHSSHASINQTPPHPLQRAAIEEPLVTGVRVIDGMLTCGKGQRMGIFAGSGVGKSTLLGSIARNSESDISVIALIGERGREVREFLERDLGPEGLARSVIIVSTSDQPALMRLKAASVAMTVAEYFRDEGMDVMFMMDSVTRFAMAQREIGLSIGEPPASKGYTPSVFALLPKLLERAGKGETGSITGFFTVLVEGDDFNEPICDAVRGILDGHIILSRTLAARNHYPAIDVLNSVSRVMPALTSKEHLQLAAFARKNLAVYEKFRDLVNIGAYVKGSDPEADTALLVIPELNRFLQQGRSEVSAFNSTIQFMSEISQISAVN